MFLILKKQIAVASWCNYVFMLLLSCGVSKIFCPICIGGWREFVFNYYLNFNILNVIEISVAIILTQLSLNKQNK